VRGSFGAVSLHRESNPQGPAGPASLGASRRTR